MFSVPLCWAENKGWSAADWFKMNYFSYIVNNFVRRLVSDGLELKGSFENIVLF